MARELRIQYSGAIYRVAYTLLTLLALVVAFTAYAQTNEQVAITNWYMYSSRWRELDGKLCDTTRSQNFAAINYVITVKNEPDGAVLMQRVHMQRHGYIAPGEPGQQNGGFVETDTPTTVNDNLIIVRNYGYVWPNVNGDAAVHISESERIPVPSAPAEGIKTTLYAFRIGTISTNGETLELWDCGKPHIVGVVGKTLNSQATNSSPKDNR